MLLGDIDALRNVKECQDNSLDFGRPLTQHAQTGSKGQTLKANYWPFNSKRSVNHAAIIIAFSAELSAEQRRISGDRWRDWKHIFVFFTAPACQGNLQLPLPQEVLVCPATERGSELWMGEIRWMDKVKEEKHRPSSSVANWGIKQALFIVDSLDEDNPVC